MRPTIYSVSGTERSAFFLPAITVSSSLLLWVLVRKFETGLYQMLRQLAGEKVLVVASVIAIFLLVAFATAHVVDLLSHALFERFLSDTLDCFPHERVVPYHQTTKRYKKFLALKRTNIRRTSFIFEGAKALVAAASIWIFVNLQLRHPNAPLRPFITTLFEVANAYCVLALVISASLALPAIFVHYAPWGTYDSRRRLGISNSWRLSRVRRKNVFGKFMNRILHIVFLIVLAPFTAIYDIADRLIRELFRLNSEIDIHTYDRVLRVAESNLRISFSEIRNNDRFWLPHIYVINHGGPAANALSESRKKASFYRNQAMACLLSSIILGSAYRMAQHDIAGFLTRADVIHLAIALYFLAWLLHWKFLQQYYSLAKAVLRIFATLPESVKKAGGARKGEEK